MYYIIYSFTASMNMFASANIFAHTNIFAYTNMSAVLCVGLRRAAARLEPHGVWRSGVSAWPELDNVALDAQFG